MTQLARPFSLFKAPNNLFQEANGEIGSQTSINRYHSTKSEAEATLSNPEASETDIDKLIYEYRMRMRLVGKEETMMIVDDKDLVRMDLPDFLGKIGVNMNKLEYYHVKESARVPSKCLHFNRF
jgi:hypothetical protein